MTTYNEIIPQLLREVTAAFDSLNSKNEAGASLGPSPLGIYRAANLLYQLCHEENPIISTLASETMKEFDSLLSSVDDVYLSNIILKEINAAFDDLTGKAKASLQELTLHPNVISYREKLEKDLSKCFAALKPLETLYGYTKASQNGQARSTRCCRLGFSTQMCLQMAFLYDTACQLQSSIPMKECLLNTFSCLLTFGMIKPSIKNHDNNEDDAIQSVMTLIQQISTEQGQTSTGLGDLLQWQKRSDFVKENETMEKLIDSTFSTEVHAQKDYLLLMLASANTSSKMDADAANAKQSATKYVPSTNDNKKTKTKAVSGIERLVSQVRDLFPFYGDGYIEAALACYNHNLENTTAALLELQSDPSNKSIHPRLKLLDPKLPSRRKGSKNRYDDDETEADLQAKEIQRRHLREMEVQQENEEFILAQAMGEYDDDYDDQYDGVGGGEDGVGGMDGGLYDMDYAAVKAYNKVARGAEEDRLFWEENQNTNRRKAKGSGNKNGNKKSDSGDGESDSNSGTDENDNQKKFRGPEKGKGGRLIGPDGRYLPFPKSKNKGGGQQNNNNNAQGQQDSKVESTNTKSGNKQNGNGGKVGAGGGGNDKKKDAPVELTKIQKRRKNDNKAKIGNHNRKDRATKKGAM
mmetsp:Transcript_15246/g.22826  ORF Transcript_15246/g.22826 Transcript_15246/m.22826 type:complete len:636 (+) Transcript_15246:149-2056(+)